MSARDNGGPAFPQQPEAVSESALPLYTYSPGSPGMTLRDWFATHALAECIREAGWPVTPDRAELAAFNAYTIADAMLAERQKP